MTAKRRSTFGPAALAVWLAACGASGRAEPTSETADERSGAGDERDREAAVRAELACCEALGSPSVDDAMRAACRRLPRPIEPALRVETLPAAVPAPTATYALDTGGDQMGAGGCRGVQVGLWVVVEVGTRRLSRQVASCDGAGFGEPPGVASCDERTFELELRGNAVIVREDGAEVARVELAE